MKKNTKNEEIEAYKAYAKATTGQTETCNFQTENGKKEEIVKDCQLRLQELSEKIGKSHDLRRLQLLQYRSAIARLQWIFEELQDGSKDCPGEKTISSASFEQELARCISGCLPDVQTQKKDISRIRDLVAESKLVRSLPDGTLSVSPFRAHMLFQDNYEGSCLCRLFDLLFADFENSKSMSITY